MRILLYGGSFNPPHLGHVDAVRAALAQGWAEKVIVMPTAESPHKTLPLFSPTAKERYELCRLAFEEIGCAEVSDLELKRGGISYTSETVDILQAMNPGDEVGFLMGTDMFMTLESWHEYEALFSDTHILVLPRSDNELSLLREKAAEYVERYRWQIQIIEKPPLELSSTEVRRALPNRLGRDMLGEKVYAAIIRQRFYGAKPDLHWLREQGYAMLKSKRIPHVQGCEEMAVAMAECWREDKGRAAEAAILHDCTKKLSAEEHLALCEKYGIPLDDTERNNEQLLHSKTGAAVAKELFGVDEGIASAIFWHTTGRPHMTTLEKILYLSDAAEPNRDYPGVQKLRKLCFEDLDAAMILGLRMSLDTVKKRGQKTHEMSRKALASLLAKEESQL